MSKLIDRDFKYSIDYDYNTQYSCEDSGCNEEGICRCGMICDEHINSIEVDVIVGDIYAEYFDNSMQIDSALDHLSKFANKDYKHVSI